MYRDVYRSGPVKSSKKPARKWIYIALITLAVLILGVLAYKFFGPTTAEQAANNLEFDGSVSTTEQQTIKDAIQAQSKTYSGTTTVGVTTTLTPSVAPNILSAYVPVANKYSSRQAVTTAELSTTTLYVASDMDEATRAAIATAIGSTPGKLASITGEPDDIRGSEIALITADSLTSDVKLLKIDEAYYLDSFISGAVFRQANFTGDAATSLADLQLNTMATKDTTLKVNMSGVTALTRVMQKKLASVKDPLYFSKKIGDFMADADITHVSNEVSFREGCAYSNVLFCSPPEFIETLKDTGVDLVELTGNHNNDNGNIYNTESIELYHSLGWATVGGGLNTAEAAKPYLADKKGSKVTFLAYNLADGAGSGAIAGSTTAGANIYTDEKAQADITSAKANSQFVVVNIQYAECQAYPSGYVEFPQCDGPIGGQEAAFREIIDMGADMVVGSSAHQPQTYEFYKDGAIYYGLGNMYFDQTQWPGTERGIILTNYFAGGKLVQTKMTVTDYNKDLQTQISDAEETTYLLDRLNTARP